MPLLLGVVALAAAVGVGAAVLIVPRLHHSAAVHRNSPATVNSSPATGGGTSPASPASVTPSAPPSREQAAKGLSGLLAQSVTDRSSIVQAVGDVSQCGPDLGSDARTLDNAAASRQGLLGQLQNLPGRSALPSGMLAALAGAWQHSMEADRDYAQWARDEQSRGCTQNDQSDSNYQAASGPDRQATTGKQSFVAQWNPIATRYGLRTYQWDQL